VGQVVSGNEESEKNDGSSGSYESPSDPSPSIKRKRSFGPQVRITYQKKRYTSIRN
jgi:hypothetical protein